MSTTATNVVSTVAPPVLAKAGLISTAMIPVVGPAVAAVGLSISVLLNRSRMAGLRRIEATRIVNDLEPMLQRNVEAYFEGPRTRTSQAVALKSFDDAWAWLISSAGCGNPELAKAGRACIADRSRGGRWDWNSYYRDPIANDPEVRQDTAVEAMLGLDLSSPGDASKWLIPGLLLLVALAL